MSSVAGPAPLAAQPAPNTASTPAMGSASAPKLLPMLKPKSAFQTSPRQSVFAPEQAAPTEVLMRMSVAAVPSTATGP
jgi:hypothetical protein